MEAEKIDIDWEEFDHIHVIKKMRHILNSWWNVDLIFTNEKGELQESLLERSSFKNPLIKKPLLLSEPVKSELTSTLASVLKNIRSESLPHSFQELESLGGLSIGIVPIIIENDLMGSVVGIGFLKEGCSEKQKVQIKQKWKQACPSESDSEVEKSLEKVKVLKDQELNRFLELLELTAHEIVTLYDSILNKENRLQKLSENLESRHQYDSMIGKSEPMQDLYSLLDKIKTTDSTVLIQGENGTGKELIAKSIHYNSSRKNKAFVIQNCSAFNDNLLESELFGHVKGSFTGAIRDKKGLFEKANNGTFFLDEIGDTSPIMQVKLLRVLQEGTFTPVGALEPKQVNVRVIAATNKDLRKMVEEKLFREDLYYRLNVINIQVPVLRDRKDDIPLLVEYFLSKYQGKIRKSLSQGVMKKLYHYSWPGNVRELQNEVERLLVLSGNERQIIESMLSSKVLDESSSYGASQKGGSHHGQLKEAIEELEQNMIREGLRRTGWNKSELAKELGISRAGLIMKVKKYKLDSRKMAS